MVRNDTAIMLPYTARNALSRPSCSASAIFSAGAADQQQQRRRTAQQHSHVHNNVVGMSVRPSVRPAVCHSVHAKTLVLLLRVCVCVCVCMYVCMFMCLLLILTAIGCSRAARASEQLIQYAENSNAGGCHKPACNTQVSVLASYRRMHLYRSSC
jgi:hypothetical protein